MIELLEKDDFKPGARRGPINRPKDARNSPSRHLLEEKKRSKDLGSVDLPEADRNNNPRSIAKKAGEPPNGAANKNVNKSGFSGGKREASPVDPKQQEAEEPLDDLDDSGLLVDKQIRQYMPDEQDPRRQPKPSSSPLHKPLNPTDQGKTQFPMPPLQNQDPKLYVDVNIGKQGMERIVVYEGDTAEGLAKEFCEKNGLTEDMEEKLRMLLEQQIAGVLPKIVEDDVNESEEDSSIQYGNRRGTDAKFPEQKAA